jgi:dTDP-4-dehydro-2,6-dideoxy-D-glucose 3-dehydratase
MQQLQSARKSIKYGGVIAGLDEINAVVEVLKGQAWGCGDLCLEFEAAAAKAQGRQYALFVNSGSSALLAALATLPKGTRVAMPALQFPTLYSSAIWCGLEPVLVDIDDSLNLDPNLIPEDVGAVAFVHIAGNPTNVSEVADICTARGIPLIEDNCEGFGGSVALYSEGEILNGDTTHRLVGNYGAISCTSTHAAHQIATGEGGLVFTDDEETYWKMRRIRDWGRAYGAAQIDGYYDRYVFSEVGLNLHASDIQAALGLVQLKRLWEFASWRRTNYFLTRSELKDLPIDLPRLDANAFPSWYTFPLLTDRRDDLRAHLEDCGIETRTILVGNLQRQPIGCRIEGSFPVADDVFHRGLWFSVHPRVTEDDRKYIVSSVRGFFGKT